MTRIISVEGNIGSGKSVFVKELEKRYEGELKIHFLQEPVDIWQSITDKEGKNILECYYEDQKKYAFSFQMMAYISRVKILVNAMKENYDIIITERSVHTDKNVFAQMLYDEGKIEEIEYKIYNIWFDEFLTHIPEIEIVYLKTNPEISDERIKKRGRKGEDIPLAYLKECHNYHEKWFEEHKPSIILDANEDIKDKTYSEKINEIMNFIKNDN